MAPAVLLLQRSTRMRGTLEINRDFDQNLHQCRLLDRDLPGGWILTWRVLKVLEQVALGSQCQRRRKHCNSVYPSTINTGNPRMTSIEILYSSLLRPILKELYQTLEWR